MFFSLYIHKSLIKCNAFTIDDTESDLYHYNKVCNIDIILKKLFNDTKKVWQKGGRFYGY